MKRRVLALLLAVLTMVQLTACRSASLSTPAADPMPPASDAPDIVSIPETEESQAEPQISVQWADDGLDGFSAYDSFTADTAQPQSRVLFTTDARVENVKVLALTLENVDEDGHMTFSTRELYTLEALTPEHPLVVAMTFYGAIPNYGISYVDGNGAARSFAVEMSGEDGSLVLWVLDG